MNGKILRWIWMILFIFLFMTGMKTEEYKAAESAESRELGDVSDMDDPEYWRAQGYRDAALYEGSYASRESQQSTAGRGEYTLRTGIDVSKWQGNIDWAAAKAAGVEFAIIRVGYRSDSTGNLAEDTKYIQNIEGALENGIRVGVYIFSQAITVEEAMEEANYVLSRIYKYNITLPIVIDYEYRSGENGLQGRLYNANLSVEQATAICDAFCDTVEAAGYTGMVYANKSMLISQLNAGELAAEHRIWLAHYTSATNYTGIYDFWQYTDEGDGYAYGMESQYVDMNRWYDDGKIYGKDYSAVFDAEYYADLYPDLKAAFGDDAAGLLTHFIQYGMNEGRQASATFNVQSYKNLYADLRSAFGDDLRSYYIHYIQYGQKEGRIATGYENVIVNAKTIYNDVNYEAVYDFNYYVANNLDVLQAYGYDENAVLCHFIQFGMEEGRQACATFNLQSYKNLYADLRNAFGDDLGSYYMHYIKYGQKEGRIATNYENVIVNAKTTYNDVNYAAVYDFNYYVANNSDVLQAYGYDENAVLSHFIQFGMKEGRQAIASFNVRVYHGMYADLQQAFGDELVSYYIHFIEFGKAEGRVAVK